MHQNLNEMLLCALCWHMASYRIHRPGMEAHTFTPNTGGRGRRMDLSVYKVNSREYNTEIGEEEGGEGQGKGEREGKGGKGKERRGEGKEKEEKPQEATRTDG